MMPDLPGWHVRSVGGSGCPFATTVLNTDAGNQHAGNCPQRNADIVKEIDQVHPDVVVITARGGWDANDIASQYAEYRKIAPAVGLFVVLPPNPGGVDPGECYTKFSAPAACVANVDSRYRAQLANNEKMATELKGVYVDPRPLFCVNDYCPEFVGRTPIRRDSVHITEAYSAELGPPMLEMLRARHVFG